MKEKSLSNSISHYEFKPIAEDVVVGWLAVIKSTVKVTYFPYNRLKTVWKLGLMISNYQFGRLIQTSGFAN